MDKGDKFTKTFQVTEAIYKGYAALFKDSHLLHTDEDFAKNKGFNGVVMHGNILNGFISHFIGECLPVKDVLIHSQQIEYCHAVYLNDILDFDAVIVDVFESVRMFEFEFSFRNKEKLRVAKGKFRILTI